MASDEHVKDPESPDQLTDDDSASQEADQACVLIQSQGSARMNTALAVFSGSCALICARTPLTNCASVRELTPGAA